MAMSVACMKGGGLLTRWLLCLEENRCVIAREIFVLSQGNCQVVACSKK